VTQPTLHADADVEWVRAATGLRCIGVRRERVGTGDGVLGELTRLHLTYAKGWAGPCSLVLKRPSPFASNNERALRFRLYEREVRFYEDVARTIDLRVPHCYASRWDDTTQEMVLLLEDLGDLRCGDQLAGLSSAQALVVAERMSRAHAQWWDSAPLASLLWLPCFGDPVTKQLGPLCRELWPTFLDLHGASLPPGSRAIGERACDDYEDLLERISRPPVTLAHGDLRAENLLFGDGDLAVIDWQLASRGRGVFDIAYLLCQSLTVPTRRRHEIEILRHWHDTLVGGGVAGYSFADAIADHRLCSLVSLGWTVAGTAIERTNERARALARAQAVRAFTAALDYGHFDP
jgi:hypothetical protein